MKTVIVPPITAVVQPDPVTLELKLHLIGFWAADKWDMAECPLLPVGKTIRHTFIEFRFSSETLNIELKYACWHKFNGGGWSPVAAPTAISRVRTIMQFLQEMYPDTQSLLERELDEWLSALRAYLMRNGLWTGNSVVHIDKSQTIRLYQAEDSRLSTFRGIYRVVLDRRETRPEYEKDIWDVRKMGNIPSPAQSSHRVDFTKISQPWLRQAAKHYMRLRLPTSALSTCLWALNTLNTFSAFLRQLPRSVQPFEIDRALITEYLAYLAMAQPGVRTRQNALTQLRLFLETCTREGWTDFPEKRLIFDEDIPRRAKPLPRPIPESVLELLNQHLDSLPEPFKTMTIVLQECGMRISELCHLQLDCLVQDQDGDWFLRYFQWKMRKEHAIPITQNLATVIQTQQEVVRTRWNGRCPFLFPNEKGRPYVPQRFSQALNQLALEKDIRDPTGEVFHFKAHAFRHTVATRMLRGGVKQHHVQKYLGHESPEMTMVYAQITDQDLKQAFREYQTMAIDITGKMVIADQTGVDSVDLQWFKKNIMAQALPHGFCALPALAEPCPVPNACLTCANFRTNASFLGVLKAELTTTEAIINTAKTNNWTRQIEMNERVATNLRKIIGSLEAKCNDAQEKH